MTSKEKYLQKLAGRQSDAVKNARERIKNREWLKESQKLAIRILLRLDELKWTQAKLATELGVTPQYVNKLLKGKEKFGWDNLIAIQRILDMPILYTTQSKTEMFSKSYSKSGEIEKVENVTFFREKAVNIQMGRIIPLFTVENKYSEVAVALEM